MTIHCARYQKRVLRLPYRGGYLYASSPTTVFRWKYKPGQRSDLGAPSTVINNIPCCHHVTRTIVFDDNALLYVQSGSGSNVDPDSSHSQIRRFSLASVPPAGINWSQGELFADGLRNEVGLRFDANQQLWGVENGCDDLFRSDLGGDIHNTNPSEEVNLFTKSGQFYGYPYCWSEFQLPNETLPGTQWLHPNFQNDGTHSDSWCKNTNNVVKPAWNLDPHTAPLDILFWNKDSFPSKYKGNAFVSLHGSWDRQPPAGYRVDLIELSNSIPVKSTRFLSYIGPGDKGPNWPHRPVGMAISPCLFGDCLLVTSDKTGIVIAVGYSGS